MTLATTTEWIKCLLSPSYAETTYLRITQADEDRAVRISKAIVAVLCVAAVLACGLAVKRYQELVYLRNHPETQKIHIKIRIVPPQNVQEA